jgi:hypothetical protein
MISPSLIAQSRYLRPITTILLVTLTLGAKCKGGSSGGGITIPQSDATPPTLSLQSAQPSGNTATVSAGGSAQSMKLLSKTGSVNLAATAKDGESGVQALEIWVNKKTTSCTGNMCQPTGPGLLGSPQFESTSPKKNPGETTPESSIMLQALDLTKEIPQGAVQAGSTRKVELILFARARNHLSGQSQTPELTLTWSEP